NLTIREPLDGISFLPTLKGERRKQRSHTYLYWEFHELGGRRALRQGDWKLVQYDLRSDPPGAYELYNLKKDPSEQRNVAAQYPGRVEALAQLMDAARTPSPSFPFAADAE